MTAAVGNMPVRAVVARSPAWTRGGSLGRARGSEGGKRRGKHGGVGRLFEAEAVRQRRGSRGGRLVEGGNGDERGAGTAWDSAAARHQQKFEFHSKRKFGLVSR
jgi:hypothetical protein